MRENITNMDIKEEVQAAKKERKKERKLIQN